MQSLSQRQLEILRLMEVDVWRLRPDIPASGVRLQEGQAEPEPASTRSGSDVLSASPRVTTQPANQVTELPVAAANWCAVSEGAEVYDWIFVCQTVSDPLSGSPAARKLYDAMLYSLGLKSSDVCTISTWLKPEHHATNDRLETVLTGLIAANMPKVIVVLGERCARTLLGSNQQENTLRNEQHRYGECAVVVTHGLEELLVQPGNKAETWQDLTMARQLVEA